MTVPKNNDDAIYFNSRSKKWGFLSNISESPFAFAFEGRPLHVKTAEGAYQAMKIDPNSYSSKQYFVEVVKIIEADGLVARKLGKSLKHTRPNWNEIRFQVMCDVILAKFTNGSKHSAALLKTGTRQIIHYAPWDTYWGVNAEKSGHNQLGRILMSLRYDKQLSLDLATNADTAEKLLTVTRAVDKGYEEPVVPKAAS